MAKYCGNIGYADLVETEPGVWAEGIVPRLYYGDTIIDNRRLQSSENVNDNVNISNRISIVADPYANQNIYKIRYAEYQGAKWKVSNVEVQRPRIILTLGEVYNGDSSGITE